MKKRLFASALLIFMLLLFPSLLASARETGNPFPFSKYSNYTLVVSTAYPAFERDLRESKKVENHDFQYKIPVYVEILKYGPAEVSEDEYDSVDNFVASQTAEIKVYKIDGLWEHTYESHTYPKVGGYDVGIHSMKDIDYNSTETTIESIVDALRAKADKGLASDKKGVHEVTEYAGGWLYTYSYARLDYADKVYSRESEYRYIRPIPEVPGLYMELSIGFTGGDYYDSSYNFDETAFKAVEQEWRDKFFNVDYVIEWKDDYKEADDASSDITESVTQSAEQESGEDDGVVVSDDIVEGSGKKDSDSDKGSSKSGSVKSSHDYDDDGMGVGGAIAVGVLSTGAAVGAGAAAASSGKGKNNNGKKKKSYKMYVQKDFGDAIRRGAAKPVKIRARMAEVGADGVSRDRNDLTALIGVSGDGMTIHDAALVGRYCEATVSVPENNYNDTANIIFTFNGEGGTFTNTVIFRLVDGPSIKFVEETEKPGEFILSSSRCYIDAIYGDKFTYTAKFMVVDATVMPEVKDITADKINGFDVRFEETDRQYVYQVIIKNNTAALPEKEQSVFAKPTEMTFDFHVKEQGEDKPLEGHVSMCMHNEGITVSSKEIKREALWIDTLPVENSGVSFSDIRPVLFDVLVCYIGKDGAVILKNPEVSFGDINDKGLYGNTFKENFRFKTARLSDGTHGFFPIDTLPQACEPYEALLPITYKGEKKLEAEMPLRLGGEEPTPPSQAEWEKAYEKLKKDIEIFGVDTNDSTTKYLLAHAHEHSAEELAFTRKWIIIAGMHFYAEQSRQYQKIDQTMTRYIIVANSFVKAGDYAVEVLLTMYWGKTAGKITANFVNPLKNMLANYIGQYIGPGSESGTGDYEKMPFFKTILSGTQDALSEAMTGDLKPDPEKLGYIVSAYLMVSFVKHYYEGEDNVKGDIYRSMIAAGGDLTLAKFKAWLSNKISEYSEAMWKKIGQLFGSVIRTYFNGALKEAAENAGKKAFESSIRSAVQSGGVDSLKYATAKLAKEGAKAIQEESSKILLKQYSESLGKEMASGMNTALAFVLNYCFGGTKDENEMLGLSVEDVLQELFFDRFGVYINKVYTAVKNPLDLGIKVSNGILSIEILGYVVEIPLEKNALVVIGLVFDFCFGWMEDLWNIATSNPSSLPDPRDTVTYASAKLEEGKEILENMPPITYHKKV